MANVKTRKAPWKVGVLFSQSGLTAIVERVQLNGVMLAIEELNERGGILGREIVPVLYDPASKAGRYEFLSERLLGSDGVNVIFGCYMSSSRKEVLPVVERRNGLLFYPTLYEGFEYSANVIYGGAVPNQNSVPLASFIFGNYGNRLYLVGSDYIYPRESNRVMRHIVRQAQGEVVGEEYLPLDASKKMMEKIVSDIKSRRPDAIFSTVVGDGTVKLYQAYKDAGLDPRSMPIASLTTSEAEVMSMGPEVAEGHITAAPYFNTLETPASTAFVGRYQRKFGGEGREVTGCCEAAYFQTHMFAQALKRAGTQDTETLRKALLGAEFDAPQGTVRIDPDNSHTYLHTRIAKVDREGRFVIEREVANAIKPDPYLVYPALNDWRLGLRRATLEDSQHTAFNE